MRHRCFTIALLLVCQTAWFLLFLPTPLAVFYDNVRYEEAGWRLANGQGLSLPYALMPDPEVRSWACDRDGAACPDDGSYPTALYPPLYQGFIAVLYLAFDRSLTVVFFAHWVLLIVALCCYESLLFRVVQKTGYIFGVVVAAGYPFVAHIAAQIRADHLHLTLVAACVLVPFLALNPWQKAGCFGLLLSLATLARPYTVLAVPVLMLFPPVVRVYAPTIRTWCVAICVFTLPFVLWSGRNADVFGRFIPLTVGGLGTSLYLNVCEAELGSSVIAANAIECRRRIAAFGPEPLVRSVNQALEREAVSWIRAHPWQVAALLPRRAPRLWISLGYNRKGLSAGWPLLVVGLGGLLALACVGGWVVRRDPRYRPLLVLVVGYWLFLLHTPAEARRTLPLRLPALVLAATAVDAAVRRRQGEPIPYVTGIPLSTT